MQTEQNAPKYAQDIIHTTAHTWQTASLAGLAPALAQFQAKLAKASIKKDGAVSYTDRGGKKHERNYLTLDGILHVVRPLLAECGLSVIQHRAGDDLATIILHDSGEQLGALMPFEAIQDNGRSNLQNLGAGLSYLRRYALCAALGISADADDDGEAKEQPSNEKPNAAGLPVLPYTRAAYDKAALRILSDGTLTEVEKHYFIPYNVEATLYKMALDFNKKADEAEAATAQQ